MIVLKKWLLISLTAFFMILLLVLSLAPPVARWLTEEWLVQQGLDAEFQYFSVSLGRGRIELTGLSGRDGQGYGFNLDRLVVDITLLPLLERQLVIESVELDGLSLDVVRTPDDTIVGGLSLARLAKESPAAEVRKVDVGPGLDWSVQLQRLHLANVQLCVGRESDGSEVLARHCLHLGELGIEGGLSMASLQNLSLAIPGALRLTELRLGDELHSLDVLSIAELSLQALNFLPEHLQLETLSLSAVELLERQVDSTSADSLRASSNRLRYHGGLGRLQVEQIEWRPEALDIKEIRLSDLSLLLHRDKQVRLPLVRLLDLLLVHSGDASDAVPEETPSSTSAPRQLVSVESEVGEPVAHSAGDTMSLRLARFIVEGNSSIQVLDQGIAPVLQQSLTALRLELLNLDSGNVLPGSDVSLEAVVGEFGVLRLGGKVWPFRDTLNLKLSGDIEALDLLPFTGYLERAVGYQIQTGQLNQRLKIEIIDDILDARAELELDKLHLLALSSALKNGSAELQAEGSDESDTETTLLPLGVALNLLRDTDDKIYLVLPVTGHIDDPSLSVAYVLGVVTRKAVTAAVLNYYAPFGLIDLATLLVKSTTALRFEPLQYPAGQTSFTAKHRERLDKFSRLLSEKPQLSMRFCASASGADALNLLKLKQPPEGGLLLSAGQRRQLRELASERSRAIKTLLLERGAKPSQVVLCQPALVLQRFADAQVEVSL